MFTLNDFHEKNWLRMASGVFGPPHNLIALTVCVQEEVGELASAALGVTGEKERKAGKTIDDVLDACSDAMSYLSLWLYCSGQRDLQAMFDFHMVDVPNTVSGIDLLSRVAMVQEAAGELASHALFYKRPEWKPAVLTFKRLCHVSLMAGCRDWTEHLGATFNMVSDRCGSPIKVEL